MRQAAGQQPTFAARRVGDQRRSDCVHPKIQIGEIRMSHDKRILVTGATGKAGRLFIDRVLSVD